MNNLQWFGDQFTTATEYCRDHPLAFWVTLFGSIASIVGVGLALHAYRLKKKLLECARCKGNGSHMLHPQFPDISPVVTCRVCGGKGFIVLKD